MWKSFKNKWNKKEETLDDVMPLDNIGSNLTGKFESLINIKINCTEPTYEEASKVIFNSVLHQLRETKCVEALTHCMGRMMIDFGKHYSVVREVFDDFHTTVYGQEKPSSYKLVCEFVDEMKIKMEENGDA